MYNTGTKLDIQCTDMCGETIGIQILEGFVDKFLITLPVQRAITKTQTTSNNNNKYYELPLQTPAHLYSYATNARHCITRIYTFKELQCLSLHWLKVPQCIHYKNHTFLFLILSNSATAP